MLTVNELSKVAQVTPGAIRHYVRVGLLKPQRHPVTDYKLFSDDDINRLLFIRQAKGLGFALSDIQVIFEHSTRGRSPCPAVREIIQQRIEKNRTRLSELAALHNRMEKAVEQWKTMPDGVPDGNAICYLIESVS